MITIRKSHLFIATAVAALLTVAIVMLSFPRSADAGVICSNQNVVAGLLDECVPVASTTVVVGEAVSVPPGTARNGTAMCPPGTVVTGGGYSSSFGVEVFTSQPTQDGEGWLVAGSLGSEHSHTQQFIPKAVCLSVS